MSQTLEKIKKSIEGDVANAPMMRHIYSVDASLYEIPPLGIIFPKTVQDIQTTIQIAAEYGIPIIPRGGATGITGGCLGEGFILDTSKYLNRLLDIDIPQKSAECEPGVIQDQLNQAVFSEGLRLGPDTSTGNRATLGGMAANNAAGAHYLHYGNMADHLLEVDLVLSDGSIATFGKTWPAPLKEKIEPLIKKYHKEIEHHFPKIKRRSSGYLLDRLSYPAQFIAATEGSLGVISRLKVRLSPRLPKTSLLLVFFNSLEECFQATLALLAHRPFSLEVLDEHILSMGRISPALRGKLSWLPQGAKALLIGEFEESRLPFLNSTQVVISTEEQKSHVWALRKAGLGLLLSRRSYTRAVAFIEDIAIPPECLSPFFRDFNVLLESFGLEAGIYGHAGDSCLHIRPYLDLRDQNTLALIPQLMEKTCDLVKQYGGALSGEHGDGFVRSWLNPRLFGSIFYEAFSEIKTAFDPLGIMNPGKIVAAQGPLDHLRQSPTPNAAKGQTFLNFEKEGGFSLAIDLCNGNSECRKRTGLMCPSFHGEQDEKMTTRARAQSLRSILSGKQPLEELSGKGLYEVLEYCLECKGCKTECPSQVDMAKIKAEVLFHYQETHGYSLRSRLFASSGFLYKQAALFPSFSNWILKKNGLKKLLNIALERPFPLLAPRSFSSWWKKEKAHFPSSSKEVVLLVDTFTEFFEPSIGKAAVALLKLFGFSITSPQWRCCGRPAFSKGFLPLAKKQADALINTLYPFAKRGIPILGLEPSCLFTIKDDYPSLFADERASLVIASCQSVEEFLTPFLAEKRPSWPSEKKTLYFHTHCHQKALQSSEGLQKFLHSAFSHQVCELATGCCGLAGSFGYEKEHFPLSMKIGEDRLFPAIRRIPEEDILIANGFSCRSQITFGTQRRALHPVEFIYSILTNQTEF